MPATISSAAPLLASQHTATAHHESQSNPLFESDVDFSKSIRTQPFVVVRQDVDIDVDFYHQSVYGSTTITIRLLPETKVDEICFDARQSLIDLAGIRVQEVRSGLPHGPPRPVSSATYHDPYELLHYPSQYHWNAQHMDLQRARMQPLYAQTPIDLPAEDRERFGCTPNDGSLRIFLRPDPATVAANAQKRPTVIRLKTSSSTPILPTPGATSFPSSANSTNYFDTPLVGADDVEYRVTVPFITRNVKDSLTFIGVSDHDLRYPHAYTRHSSELGVSSALFPCIDDRGSRCDWRISIRYPRTVGDAFTPSPEPSFPSQSSPSQMQATETHSHLSKEILAEEDEQLEMSAVCSGLLTDEVTDPSDPRKKIMTFESEKPVPVQLMGFAVGPFEHIDLWSSFRTEEDDDKLGASALKIHGYCLPGRADEVRNACAPLALAADFLALTFSGYPFDSYKLCFVEDMVSETEPLYSLSFISTRVLYPEDVIDTEIDVTRKLIYTLATQWSGISLLPSTRRDIWVVVGIAYYMTDLFMRKLCGKNDVRFRLKVAADRLVQIDVGRASLYDIGHYLHISPQEVELLHLKAPLILFILDKRLHKASGGSTNLGRILSRLFTRARFESQPSDSIISTESFRKMCEKQSHHHRLESFWSEWIYGSGCPRFTVAPRFNKKRLCVEMHVRQIQDTFDSSQGLSNATSNTPVMNGNAQDGGERGHEISFRSNAPLQKETFLLRLLEAQHQVPPGHVAPLFTGPITIRIHEADGTPYEHIVDIRDDGTGKRVSKFEIPYNTKYKRLKATRRNKERQATAATASLSAGGSYDASAQHTGGGDGFDDVPLYCLGDTLQSAAECERFMLQEWDDATERQRDSESYEWIRMDADFEWLCEMHVHMPSYMHMSQLQQDRDVAAQEDSLLYIQRERPHPVASTFLIRTLMDTRYYYGIRTMAAQLLPLQATEKTEMCGMVQLMEAYRAFFFDPVTKVPRPNDFNDKQQYFVQCAIPEALSRVRDPHGQCPLAVRQFLLSLLLFNNNSENPISDHFFVATLIRALAQSLLTDANSVSTLLGAESSFQRLSQESEARREEDRELVEQALEQINRYLRMDEWNNSYRNIWTMAGLEAKQRLMKAGVIPVNGIEFLQYIQDDTYEEVRIKAFEALVDLQYLRYPPIFRLLLSCLSTDSSAFVRQRLLQIFAVGIAGISMGEVTLHVDYSEQEPANSAANEQTAAQSVGPLENGSMDVDSTMTLEDDPLTVVNGVDSSNANHNIAPKTTHKDLLGDDDDDDDGDLSLLVVEDSSKTMEKRKAMIERKTNFLEALKALRQEFSLENPPPTSTLSTSALPTDPAPPAPPPTYHISEWQETFWQAIQSPVLGRSEKTTLLHLSSIMFEPSRSWVAKFPLPKRWRVDRVESTSQKCVVHFKSFYRDQPRVKPDSSFATTASGVDDGMSVDDTMAKKPFKVEVTVKKPIILSRSSSTSNALSKASAATAGKASLKPLATSISTPELDVSLKETASSQQASVPPRLVVKASGKKQAEAPKEDEPISHATTTTSKAQTSGRHPLPSATSPSPTTSVSSSSSSTSAVKRSSSEATEPTESSVSSKRIKVSKGRPEPTTASVSLPTAVSNATNASPAKGSKTKKEITKASKASVVISSQKTKVIAKFRTPKLSAILQGLPLVDIQASDKNSRTSPAPTNAATITTPKSVRKPLPGGPSSAIPSETFQRETASPSPQPNALKSNKLKVAIKNKSAAMKTKSSSFSGESSTPEKDRKKMSGKKAGHGSPGLIKENKMATPLKNVDTTKDASSVSPSPATATVAPAAAPRPKIRLMVKKPLPK